ncbi:hypothetical protein Gpo141_00006021 [Globisporangium polare]
MLAPPRETKRDRRLNPIVFLDVSVGDSRAGRLLIELRVDVVPKTCENFRRLCTGETRSAVSGKRRHYAHCPFHRVVRDRFCQSGDFTSHDGSGGECTFDQPDDEPDEDTGATPRTAFKDENFILRHTGPGVLSMVNSGPDTNTSQFYLHFAPAPNLDNKHVVFGCLLGEESFSTLDTVHQVATSRGDPKQPVRISACGQLFPY